MINLLHNSLAIHLLNRIRDVSVQNGEVRRLLKEVTKVLLSEIFKSIRLEEKELETWIGKRNFPFIDEDNFVFICVLRAGLPMLESALEVMDRAKAGFIGAKRNEQTLETDIYYVRLPNLRNKEIIILDPMLATGGTLVKVYEIVRKENPKSIKSVHLIASPEGLKRFEGLDFEVNVVSVDEKLNKKGFIIPGLGDIGDRLFGQ